MAALRLLHAVAGCRTRLDLEVHLIAHDALEGRESVAHAVVGVPSVERVAHQLQQLHIRRD